MTIIEAIEVLESDLKSNNFAASLVSQFRTRGNLSQKQEFWAKKLAGDAGKPAPTTSTETFDLEKISQMFDNAAIKLKYPKVRLLVGDDEIVLSRAGSRSKYPGAINVCSPGSFERKDWFGRINTDSRLFASHKMTDAIVSALRTFSADPENIAAQYGKMTGNCCFCGKLLTDKRSTEVGYGKTCAGHYNLPWG